MPANALALALGAAGLHAAWNLALARRHDVPAATALAFAFAVLAFAPVAALRWDVEAEAVPYMVVSAAFERGLVLLSCGLYGNVIRLLPPLNIGREELDEGLAILEESLGA